MIIRCTVLTRLAGTLAQAFCFGVETIQWIAIAAAPHKRGALFGRIVIPPFVYEVSAGAGLRWTAAFLCKMTKEKNMRKDRL